jgi:hypothetical protein
VPVEHEEVASPKREEVASPKREEFARPIYFSRCQTGGFIADCNLFTLDGVVQKSDGGDL